MDRIVIVKTKSVGLALILTIFFGPIGLLYSSVFGGLFMLLGVPIIIAILFISGLLYGDPKMILGSVGILIGYLVFQWFISIIWSVIAVNRYNSRLIRRTEYIQDVPTNHFKQVEYVDSPVMGESRDNKVSSSSYLPKGNETPFDIPTLEEWLKIPGRTVNGYNIKFGVSNNKKSESQLHINSRRK